MLETLFNNTAVTTALTKLSNQSKEQNPEENTCLFLLALVTDAVSVIN
jgi:hypothetical protein